MKAEQSETSNLERPAYRLAGSNVMNWKQRKFFISLWLVAASFLPLLGHRKLNQSKRPRRQKWRSMLRPQRRQFAQPLELCAA
jgi:hypothetical protein